MNLILKIVQGPNTGAEIALVEGVNIKLGKGDNCDIVLADQTLPDLACEIEVSADGVTLLLPGDVRETLEPLQVKLFGTTAIAIGPANGSWGALAWPTPETEKLEEAPQKPEKAAPQEQPKSMRLLIVLLAILLLLLLLWFFWPYCNAKIASCRAFCSELFGNDNIAKQPSSASRWNSLDELAKAYGIELVQPTGNDAVPILKGNFKTSAERLKLTALAYSMKPGITLDLSDEESLKRAAEEILLMMTGTAMSVEKAEGRKLFLAGSIRDVAALQHVLEALKTDVPQIEGIDCSKLNYTAVATVKPREPQPVIEEPAKPVIEEPAKPEERPAPSEPPVVRAEPLARPPAGLVGVMTTPMPYIVLRNGSRVLEGAEYGGYIIHKISEDVILLKKGDDIIEWRP